MRALDSQNSVSFCLTSCSALSAASWAAFWNSSAHFLESPLIDLRDSSMAFWKFRLHSSLSFEPHLLTCAAVSRKPISHRSCSSRSTLRNWSAICPKSCATCRLPFSFHCWTSSRSRCSMAFRSSSSSSFRRRASSFTVRILSDHLRPISSFCRFASSCANWNFSTHFLASCSFSLLASSFASRSFSDHSEFIRSPSLRASFCMSFIRPVHFHTWSFFRRVRSSKESLICRLSSFA
mmetsp:Transcript_71634/g.187793  ORF Transcript_71634/g.187793 Transcript_71634/m.187793 type:complete len:236 (-) Transcript_71634:450-1157(-)